MVVLDESTEKLKFELTIQINKKVKNTVLPKIMEKLRSLGKNFQGVRVTVKRST